MATFADYSTHTMASNDFTLYPYQEVWNNDQSYLATSAYPDQSYINPTTFDSYQTQPAYSQPDQFSFGAESIIPIEEQSPATEPKLLAC